MNIKANKDYLIGTIKGALKTRSWGNILTDKQILDNITKRVDDYEKANCKHEGEIKNHICLECGEEV